MGREGFEPGIKSCSQASRQSSGGGRIAVWDFQEKALAVSYAGWLSPGHFKDVWEAYDRESFALLARIGSQVSIAQTLFSSDTPERLDDFYWNWLVKAFDIQLSSRARNPKTTRAQWGDWHERMNVEAQARAARLLRVAAREAGLTYEQRREHPEPVGWFARFKSRFVSKRA